MKLAEARVAGSDTREALSTTTVRSAGVAALTGSAAGWGAVLSSHASWPLELDINGGVWLTPALLILGIGTAIASWRRAGGPAGKRLDYEVAPAAIQVFALALFCAVVAAAGQSRMAALAAPMIVLVSGYAVGSAASLAVRACVPGIASAAAGIVAAYALGGIVPGFHVMLVFGGSGPPRSLGWSAAYLTFAGISLMRAWASLPRDQHRISARMLGAIDLSTEQTHAALAMRRVSVTFGGNQVLREATMIVAPGELVALVGGNGAGKSTLLRVAAGFVPAQTGQVTVGAEDVTSLLAEERAGAGLSFVSGARPIFPEMTVVQNLRVAAYRTHKTPKAFADATEALLELIPTLADRREDLAGVLSGGEQRLLAVAQTLYRRPTILLADELTLGLDHDARLAVMDLLGVLAEQGVAVVAVDHDLPSLLPRAHRAVLLADGTITSHDDPIGLLTKRTDLLPATFLAGVEG